MGRKKERELKPKMEKYDGSENDINYDKDDEFTSSFDDGGSYFKNVVKELTNSKNISLKTEYLGIVENFTGAKLEYLSSFGNMPYIKPFIKIFEIKRVSLNRKSRIELIRALEKREEEIQNIQSRKFGNMFGMM